MYSGAARGAAAASRSLVADPYARRRGCPNAFCALGPAADEEPLEIWPNVHSYGCGCVEECSRRKEVPKRPPNSPLREPVLSTVAAEARLKACPSAPNIARRKLSQRVWTQNTRRGAVLVFCAAPRDVPAAQAKKQDTSRRSQKSRAPPCPPPQPLPREHHAPQYPARRRYAPRARPQKCSRRTGETVTTKTTYAGSHRARTPPRPRPHDCVTAATAGEHLGNHHDPASYKRAPFVPP